MLESSYITNREKRFKYENRLAIIAYIAIHHRMTEELINN